MRKTWIAISALALLAGCGKPFATEERLSKGLVLVLPGIEGTSRFNRAIRDGLAEGGVDCAIEIRDWTACGYLTFFYNLRAEERNRKEAAKIAKSIADYQDAHPGKPVTIVGQSGGGAIVAWIAEAMPEGRKLDGVIMLAAAISPEYRLDKALANSRKGIVSFYSTMDWVFLGVGTTVFGTADGSHGSAAGRVGFVVPPDGDYSRLFQVEWGADMIRYWHIGAHASSSATPFVARYVAPLVKANQWDVATVAAVRAEPAP